MLHSIKSKLLFIVTLVISITVASNTYLSQHFFQKYYSEAVQANALTIAETLDMELEKLLHLGIPLDEISGFDKQCQNLRNKHTEVVYAGILDAQGQLLFHSKAPFIKLSTLTQQLKNVHFHNEVSIVTQINLSEFQIYNAYIPLRDAHEQKVGGIHIGIPQNIVQTKLDHLIFFSTITASIIVMSSIFLLLALINGSLIRPLHMLARGMHHYSVMGLHGVKILPVKWKDEIGELTHAFNEMIRQLHSAHQQSIRDAQALEKLVHQDLLTELPNRLHLQQKLEQTILHAERQARQFAVIFLDLDRFKQINDSLGHHIGDQVLQKVSRKLIQNIRQDDDIARIGGDEFVLLLKGIGDKDAVQTALNNIMQCFEQPLKLDSHDIHMTASLGICFYPQDGRDGATLLRNADAAMYHAKADGRNSYQFYTKELTQRILKQIALEYELRQAVVKKELFLVFQPQINLRNNKLIGVEALIRWQHPKRGIIFPTQFITLAEEMGLIGDIGYWVLRTACLQGMHWLENGFDFGTIAVNIAGSQIQRGCLVDEVKTVLAETGFPATRLELEVTEGFIMQQVECTIRQLTELRQLGVTLAIDDFGTGYSSLSYLKQLPVHKLKIDKSFVCNIPEDTDDMAITDAVIAMGKSLGLTIIAEGVISQEQAGFLKQAGCHEVQGFFYSKPIRAEELEKNTYAGKPLKL